MFNPWILLGVLLILAATNASSFFYGQHVQEAEDAKAQQIAVTDAVATANETAEAQRKRDVTAAQKRTAAATRAAMIRSQANASIAANPLPPSCDWNPATWGMLNDAINASNDRLADTSELSAAVRAANAPRKP